MKPDNSYQLAQPAEAARRVALLDETHMFSLRDFVRDLRIETGYGVRIPHFDPLDGGNRARVLFLMEAPGPKAVASGFISRDNPDPTARNLKNLLVEAGLSARKPRCGIWCPGILATKVAPKFVRRPKRIREKAPLPYNDSGLYFPTYKPLY